MSPIRTWKTSAADPWVETSSRRRRRSVTADDAGKAAAVMRRVKWAKMSESDERGRCSHQHGLPPPAAVRIPTRRTARSVAYQRDGMFRRLPCPLSVIQSQCFTR